jgi:hypothetical protein
MVTKQEKYALKPEGRNTDWKSLRTTYSGEIFEAEEEKREEAFFSLCSD